MFCRVLLPELRKRSIGRAIDGYFSKDAQSFSRTINIILLNVVLSKSSEICVRLHGLGQKLTTTV